MIFSRGLVVFLFPDTFEYRKCLETEETTKSLGHFSYSRDFVISPVSRQFPYSRDCRFLCFKTLLEKVGGPNVRRG